MAWDATELAEKKARGGELHASSSRSKKKLPVGVCTNRAGSFLQFLLDAFGRERLDKGIGVVKVAGE
jgi:phosphoglycolate phosphatase-like HAD superfamily hydrolase